jgi:DNA-binding transcriptional MerR regulator
MAQLFTSGQAAKKLRVSISTLKRWLDGPDLFIPDKRNYNGWRLFSEADIIRIQEYRREMKRSGKRFNETMLTPVNSPNQSETGNN